MDASQDYTTHSSLVGEKSIGPMLTFHPGLGFVFENTEGHIVGYIFSAPCYKTYQEQVGQAWLPRLREKYPVVEQGEGELLTPCDLAINTLHRDPELLVIDEPESYGVCKLAMLSNPPDASLARRATTLLLACLRTSGILKVVTEVPKKERYLTDLYTKLGFSQVPAAGEAEGEGGSQLLFRRY